MPSNALGILLIDIDHFKQINDTYGHDAGDQVLIDFVNIIKETCRQSDWLVRWGGEEFALITKELKLEELQDLAERIRVNVEAHEFQLDDGQMINRTCSIGISSFPFCKNKKSALTWQQTFNLSDFALYAAKNSTRNTWICFYSDYEDIDHNYYEKITNNMESSIERGLISFRSQLAASSVKFNT